MCETMSSISVYCCSTNAGIAEGRSEDSILRQIESSYASLHVPDDVLHIGLALLLRCSFNVGTEDWYEESLFRQIKSSYASLHVPEEIERRWALTMSCVHARRVYRVQLGGTVRQTKSSCALVYMRRQGLAV